MKKAQLPALTSLRFVAAIGIVLLHIAPLWGWWTLFEMPLQQAVSFFFVLSGFVLAYAYPEFTSRERIWFFYTTRLARVWPAHIATALLALALTPKSPLVAHPNAGIIFLNFFLLHAWVPLRDVLLSLNPVSWAISVEVFFYACFPFIIRDWKQKWHWLLAGTATLVLLIVFINNVSGVRCDDMSPGPGVSVLGTIYMFPVVRLFEFMEGIAAASVYMHVEPRVEWTRHQATVVELGTILFGLFILRLCMVDVLQKSWLGEAGQYYILRQGASFMWAVLIVIFALGRGRLAWMLSRPLAIRLGEASFSLYLVHTLVLRHFELFKAEIERHPQLWHCGYWVVSLIMAYAVFTGVERPMKEILVSVAKRSLLRDTELELPPLFAIVRPIAIGATIVAGLVLFSYGARSYFLAGR